MQKELRLSKLAKEQEEEQRQEQMQKQRQEAQRQKRAKSPERSPKGSRAASEASSWVQVAQAQDRLASLEAELQSCVDARKFKEADEVQQKIMAVEATIGQLLGNPTSPAAEKEAGTKIQEAARAQSEKAARVKAEEAVLEAARLKAAEEATRLQTAEEAAQVKARLKAKEAARVKAAEEAARVKAAEEAARVKAAEEAARVKAAEEAARVQAANEAARARAATEAQQQQVRERKEEAHESKCLSTCLATPSRLPSHFQSLCGLQCAMDTLAAEHGAGCRVMHRAHGALKDEYSAKQAQINELSSQIAAAEEANRRAVRDERVRKIAEWEHELRVLQGSEQAAEVLCLLPGPAECVLCALLSVCC